MDQTESLIFGTLALTAGIVGMMRATKLMSIVLALGGICVILLSQNVDEIVKENIRAFLATPRGSNMCKSYSGLQLCDNTPYALEANLKLMGISALGAFVEHDLYTSSRPHFGIIHNDNGTFSLLHIATNKTLKYIEETNSLSIDTGEKCDWYLQAKGNSSYSLYLKPDFTQGLNDSNQITETGSNIEI
mmetsp:Transcript_16800/g.30860  ORF Transcript_16800/g.30860 Transcript_16800/m.30860 type:complete len:189 (-) Transcript_16800:92-658(-)